MMKKRDFLYIFYGLKIIVGAFAFIAFIFGVGWLFVHYHRFATGFIIVWSLAALIGVAWGIGEHKYWDEEKDVKND
jgi:uncharacterized membrane protein YqjE